MTKTNKIEQYYIIINTNNEVYIRKYLSKVQSITQIAQNTLAKHFSLNSTPYINNEYTIFKTSNVDFKSFNKGNVNNFITSL